MKRNAGDGNGKDNRTNKIHEDDELHAKTERSAQVANEDELHEVMNGRVDPPSTLREKNRERVGNDRSTFGLRQEHHLAIGERAQ